MKLDKFGKIRGHRIFKNFTWPTGLEEFGRFNLIYGWNGSGKTTLSNLFKAVQAKSPVKDGEAEFIFDGNRIAGQDLSSDTALPGVRVFNRDSVSRGVFESLGGAPGQLPPVYVFGEDSAEKQRQIDALKAQLPALTDAANSASAALSKAQNDLNDYAAASAKSIKNLLVAPGGSFNNYNATDFRTNITRFEQEPPPELGSDERAQLLNMKDAKPLAILPIPVVPFPDLQELQREAKALLAETVVSQVIDELAKSPQSAAWVAEGLALHTDGGDSETCKFCSQPLPPDRLRRIEAHFNDQFRKFTNSLKLLVGKVEAASLALEKRSMPKGSELYPDLQQEYVSKCQQLDERLGEVRRGLQALANAIRSKQERVFERLVLEDLLTGSNGTVAQDNSLLMNLLQALNAGLPIFSEMLGKTAFSKIQTIIGRHNSKTETFSEQVKVARSKLHQHELVLVLPGWLEKQKALGDAREKKESENQAKTKAESEIRALETDILEHRQPADELNRELVAYLGHNEIQVAVEDTGYRLMRRGHYATNLSEGERTAIAFLYFLKSLDDRSFDLKNGIVVVDDPISSLDSNSIYSAFGFMKRKLHDAGQLFVLTHNFTFLRQVRNWFKHVNHQKVKPGQPARFYMLRARVDGDGRSSSIEAMDSFLRDYESEYHYLFKRIVEASSLPENDSLHLYYELPNLARRLLESFLIFKVPNENSLFKRLEAVDFDGPKKTRLQRFLDMHSHAELIAEGHDEASSLAEAPDVLKDLLELIEKCDAEHFQRMKNSISA